MFFFRFLILFFFSLSVFGSTSLEKEFFEASMSGNLEKLNDLMKNEDLKLDFQDENGKTVFHHLAEKLDLKTLNFLAGKTSKDFDLKLLEIIDKNKESYFQVMNKFLTKELKKKISMEDFEKSDPSLISKKLLESAEKEDVKNLIYYLRFGDITTVNSNSKSQNIFHILALKGNVLILMILSSSLPSLEKLNDLKDVNSDTWKDILKKKYPSRYKDFEDRVDLKKDLKSILQSRKDKKVNQARKDKTVNQALQKEFFEASMSGNLEKLNDLMKNKELQIDFQDENGKTVFHHLAEKIDLKTLNYINIFLNSIEDSFYSDSEIEKINDKNGKTWGQLLWEYLSEEFSKEFFIRSNTLSNQNLMAEKIIEFIKKEDVIKSVHYLKIVPKKDFLNEKEQSVLHLAAETGNAFLLEIIKETLKSDPALFKKLDELTDVNGETWEDLFREKVFEMKDRILSHQSETAPNNTSSYKINESLQKEFFEASMSGNLEKLNDLMENKDLKLDFQDENGKTVFHHLAEKLDLKTLAFITDRISDDFDIRIKEIKNKDGKSWSEVFSVSVEKEVFKEFSEKDLEDNDERKHFNQLVQSIKEENFTQFLYYWKLTHRKDFLNEKKQSFLHVASEVGNVYFLNFIIKQFDLHPSLKDMLDRLKTDVNGETWKDIYKKTYKKKLAIQKKYQSSHQTKKIPPTLLEKEFFKAVVENNDEKKILSLLENKNLRPDIQDEHGKTVFHHLAKSINFKIINLIAEKISKDTLRKIENLEDNNGKYWPDIFQDSVKKEISKPILIKAESQLPTQKELFESLIKAVEKQDMKAIIYYLKMKTNIRFVNKKNESILHAVAYTGNEFILQFLINQLEATYPLEENLYEIKNNKGLTWLDILKEKRPDLIKDHPVRLEQTQIEVGLDRGLEITKEDFNNMLQQIGHDLIDISQNIDEEPADLDQRISIHTRNFLDLVIHARKLGDLNLNNKNIPDQKTYPKLTQMMGLSSSDKGSSRKKKRANQSYYASDVKRFFQLVYENEYKDVSEIIKTINPKARDKHGQTALYYTEDPKMIKLLIKQGISVSTRTKRSHNTALHLTSTPKKAEILLEKQKDLISASNYEGKTPLYKAVENDSSIDLVKLYLKYGASIDHESNLKEIPIFEAVRNSNLEMIQYLIKNGSPLDYVNNRGETILHLAAHTGNIQVIIFLTFHMKGLLNHINIYGDTAMDIIKTTYPELTSEIIRLVKSNNQKLANIKRPRRSPSRVSVKK